jgi:SnoaL-like polyketide cyclase/SnoaL-like domain
MTSDATHLANKRAALSAMTAIAESTPATLAKNLAHIYHPDAQWRGSHPMNEMQGVEAIERTAWGPLIASFPDLERRDTIVMGGRFQERDYVGMVGHLAGSFRRDWNGIPATDQMIYLRYGEFHQMVDGKIVQSTVLLDVLDFIRQAGFWPMAPSLGAEGMWAGPIANDGIVLSPQAPEESAASLALTLAMQASLGAYDDTLYTTAATRREGLLNMPQRQFWHPKMMWYGPSGIGSTRGLEGFVDYHQLPFRIAFPKGPSLPQPPGMGQHGGSHYVRIGDGRFSATGGWPSRHMMHLGGGWLGLPTTGRAVTMRVMDFYRADQGLIRENWVPIDIIQVLLQLDVDVLARVRSQFGRNKQST